MASNLYEYFTGRGQALPSIQQRRQMYGLGGNYVGSAQQNTNLLRQLQGGAQSVQRAVNTQDRIPTPQVAAARTYQPQISSYTQPQTYQNKAGVDPMVYIKKYFPANQWQNAYNVMMWESSGILLLVASIMNVALKIHGDFFK